MKKQLNLKRRLLTLSIVLMCAIAFVDAQTITGEIPKQTNVTYGTGGTGFAIKVIDNKGTVKYLQAANGITALTNTTGAITTTTWQLGGTLTENTYIDVNGKIFGLDKLKLVTDVTTALSNASDASVHGGTGTGFTVLIRDEATGAIQKMKLSDLLNVKAAQLNFTIDGTTYVAGTTAISFDATYGTSTTPALSTNKLSVYRNGIKLLATTDYTVDATSGKENFVKVTPVALNWQFVVDDVIEIQWVK